ncbi:MAG: sugar ABC transporter permease [Candidatus Delongbacteria bacterium]|nr:sugar ABC transporter permease [Candidatus Delongbacteria bacterium]
MSIKTRHLPYLLLFPFLLHFMIFTLYPVLFSFFLTFHKWNVSLPMRWIGLKNFTRLLQDDLFWQSILNTLYFLVIHIPFQIVIALGLAVVLNMNIRGRGVFRAMFFMPVVVSGVVISILWRELYNYDTGIINRLLIDIGLKRIPFLIDPDWAMPSIAVMATWKNVGFYLVLFLVGLQTIPRYLYEAAAIDGANRRQMFFHITLPQLNPTILLVVILSSINGFSLFIEPYILTGGGPMNSTLSAMLYVYKQAFSFSSMGYAASLAFTFALVLLVIVVIQKRMVERDSG